jgi:hypothetical protein
MERRRGKGRRIIIFVILGSQPLNTDLEASPLNSLNLDGEVPELGGWSFFFSLLPPNNISTFALFLIPARPFRHSHN